MADEKRKFAAISNENGKLKVKAVESAELNALLEAKCGDLQEELAERSTAMDREVKKLTSRLLAQSGYPVSSSAPAQVRTKRLKQKREQLDALKAEKERLRQLRQQNGENNENDEVNEQQLAFIFHAVGLGEQTGQDTQQRDDAGKAIAAQQMVAVQEENRQLKEENEALRLKLAEFERKAAETEHADEQEEAVPSSKPSGSSGESAELLAGRFVSFIHRCGVVARFCRPSIAMLGAVRSVVWTSLLHVALVRADFDYEEKHET
ncbi:hypothetical protein M3Y99_01228100 [Aphelenchoides fujianensis]|nr:hypothetical protein M3Y99_01228100 [Aphelenchoides fujianensis]